MNRRRLFGLFQLLCWSYGLLFAATAETIIDLTEFVVNNASLAESDVFSDSWSVGLDKHSPTHESLVKFAPVVERSEHVSKSPQPRFSSASVAESPTPYPTRAAGSAPLLLLFQVGMVLNDVDTSQINQDDKHGFLQVIADILNIQKEQVSHLEITQLTTNNNNNNNMNTNNNKYNLRRVHAIRSLQSSLHAQLDFQVQQLIRSDDSPVQPPEEVYHRLSSTLIQSFTDGTFLSTLFSYEKEHNLLGFGAQPTVSMVSYNISSAAMMVVSGNPGANGAMNRSVFVMIAVGGFLVLLLSAVLVSYFYCYPSDRSRGMSKDGQQQVGGSLSFRSPPWIATATTSRKSNQDLSSSASFYHDHRQSLVPDNKNNNSSSCSSSQREKGKGNGMNHYKKNEDREYNDLEEAHAVYYDPHEGKAMEVVL
jgi:hypothetical protein